MPRPSGTCAMPSRATRSGPRRPSALAGEADLAAPPHGVRDRPQRRRLAGAVRAEHGDDLALVDRERDAVQRLHRPVARRRRPRARAAAPRLGRSPRARRRGRPRSPSGRAGPPAGGPLAIVRPKLRTCTWSETFMTRFMWCSTSSTVSFSSSRSRRMKLAELADLLVVEPARRLVEEEQARPRDERARQLDPLQRPEREPGRGPVARRRRCRRSRGSRARPAATARSVLKRETRVRADEDVLEHGHRREQLDVLERARDPVADHAGSAGVRRSERPSKTTSPASRR